MTSKRREAMSRTFDKAAAIMRERNEQAAESLEQQVKRVQGLTLRAGLSPIERRALAAVLARLGECDKAINEAYKIVATSGMMPDRAELAYRCQSIAIMLEPLASRADAQERS